MTAPISKAIDPARVGISKSLVTTPEEAALKLASRSAYEGECIVWYGARNDAGYGQVVIDGVVWYAHRLSYVLNHGPIPAGQYVCHTCDNPPCHRPEHLFAGTTA